MTTVPTPPPAGLYPAPDGSLETWWWNGTRWTHRLRHPSHQSRTTGTIAKLAVATQALLIFSAIVSVAPIGMEAFGTSAVTRFLDGQQSAIGMINWYEQSTVVVSGVSTVAFVATGVLWLTWQYRAAKRVKGRTRRSPGWHVGSWFVPIVSFWFPYQNISDLWRAVGRTRPAWQIIWWLLYIVGSFLTQQSGRLYAIAEELEPLRVAMWMNITGETLLLAAVPLAWLTIRGITEGVGQRASATALTDAMYVHVQAMSEMHVGAKLIGVVLDNGDAIDDVLVSGRQLEGVLYKSSGEIRIRPLPFDAANVIAVFDQSGRRDNHS